MWNHRMSPAIWNVLECTVHSSVWTWKVASESCARIEALKKKKNMVDILFDYSFLMIPSWYKNSHVPVICFLIIVWLSVGAGSC